MKKQHIILVPIIIMLYVIYLIISYKYDEYRINKHINNIIAINDSLTTKIEETEKLIEYKSSKAYINKILKQEQNKKNPGEQVLVVTTQNRYEKYTTDIEPEAEINNSVIPQAQVTDNMTIKQRWFYFLFKDDIR